MNARQEAMDKMRRQARALRDDSVFLRLYTASVAGVSGQYERLDPVDSLRETSFTDFERCDLLTERALCIATSAWEQLFQDTVGDLERFNSKIMQTEPEPDIKAS